MIISKQHSFLMLAASLAVCLGAGRLGSVFTTPQLAGWYTQLEKPVFTPPDLAFPIVWTTLFVVMAIAFWRAWRVAAPRGKTAAVLVPFTVQLVINVMWSAAFFGLQSPVLGLVVIVALIAAIIMAIYAFKPFDKAAAWLLAPYLAWVSYAAVLNATIVCLNSL